MYSGTIKSIVNDAAGNLSTIAYKNIYVDWTAPSCVIVNDGNGIDTDSVGSLTTLSANWTAAADSNSGITNYWYAIGTSSGATDLVNWTDNNLSTSVTQSSLNLTQGQTYYVSVKAVNGAGLTSICTSDGIVADVTAGVNENPNTVTSSLQPNPFSESTTLFFSQKAVQRIVITITDIFGKEIQIVNSDYPAGKHSITINADELQLAKGVYTCRISSNTFGSSVRLIKY